MLNSFQLKVIALVSMVVDHMGVVFFPDQVWMRMVGRISMPIFVFMLVEGYKRTKNLRKYQIRLVVAAVVMVMGNEIVGNVLGIEISNNMFLTLFMVLVFLELVELRSVLLGVPLILVNYAEYGVLVLMIALVFKYLDGMRSIVAYVILSVFGGVIYLYQYMMVLALPVLKFYNGKKGSDFRWFFYVFYPAHIWGLYLIKWGCFS